MPCERRFIPQNPRDLSLGSSQQWASAKIMIEIQAAYLSGDSARLRLVLQELNAVLTYLVTYQEETRAIFLLHRN